jgi:hypothetical protein
MLAIGGRNLSGCKIIAQHFIFSDVFVRSIAKPIYQGILDHPRGVQGFVRDIY